jgi:hypothetical protein
MQLRVPRGKLKEPWHRDIVADFTENLNLQNIDFTTFSGYNTGVGLFLPLGI